MSQPANPHVHPTFAGILSKFEDAANLRLKRQLVESKESACPPCSGDCDQGRNCPAGAGAEAEVK